MAGDLTTESQPASESFEVGQGTSISFPPSLFQLFPNDTFTLLFTMFNSSVLLPYSETAKNRSIQVASSVIGATLMNHSVSNLTNETISITLRLDDPVRNCIPECTWYDVDFVLQNSQTLACVVWNAEAGGIDT